MNKKFKNPSRYPKVPRNPQGNPKILPEGSLTIQQFIMHRKNRNLNAT